jgi:hypothetical protein
MLKGEIFEQKEKQSNSYLKQTEKHNPSEIVLHYIIM